MLNVDDLAANMPRRECVELVNALDGGFNPNTKTSKGSTLLHSACWIGNIEAVRALLGSGADPNVLNSLGSPPLVNAVMCGATWCVEALLDGGADPSIRDSDDNGIVYYAENNGTHAIINVLLRHPGLKDYEKITMAQYMEYDGVAPPAGYTSAELIRRAF